MKDRTFSKDVSWFCNLLIGCFFLFGTLSCSAMHHPRAGFNAVNVPAADFPEKKKLDQMQPSQLIHMGNQYLDNDNPQLALLHFSIALKKAPKSMVALVGVGRAFYEQGQLSRARALFKNVLKEDPENVPALLYLGKIRRKQGDFEASVKVLSKAMGKSKHNTVVMTELANVYEDMGKPNLAEPMYKQVVKNKPDLGNAYNNLGYNYILQGKYSRAIDTLMHAYNIDQGDKTIQCNLAAAYALNGDEDRSLLIFKSAVGNAAAYNNVGYLLMVKGDYNSAEKYLVQALQLNPMLYVKADANLSRLKGIKDSKSKIYEKSK
jgi:Flp pilus assembly protein TadD